MPTVNMHDARSRLASLVEALEVGRESEVAPGFSLAADHHSAHHSSAPEPKISVLMRSGATPSATSASRCAFMNAIGPQM